MPSMRGWIAVLLLAASPSYPLTYSFAARAEAPQGTADVLDVKGEGNFAMRYFVHGESRLPIMVSWQAPPTNVIVTVPGQPGPKTVAPGAVVITAPAPPPDTAPQEDKAKYAKEVAALRAKAQATPIEYRLYFADYRDVDGVKLPFRLRRAIGTAVVTGPRPEESAARRGGGGNGGPLPPDYLTEWQ